jgi:hypothetical protein
LRGCPICCALCNKWVSGLQFSCDSMRCKASRMNTCAKTVGGYPRSRRSGSLGRFSRKAVVPYTQPLGAPKRRIIHGSLCGL